MNFKEKIIEIYKENKLKTFFLIGLFLSLIISLMYLNIHDQKKNKIISEKVY
jgi:preprotein translocase subunit SecG